MNIMLMGEYHNNIDLKGRVVIPSKFREILGEKVVLTRGLDGTLFIYGISDFKDLTDKLVELPFTSINSRNFTRFMLSGAITLEFDKQGRIIIPTYLKEDAKLEKEVVIIGVLNRVEIWAKDTWDKFKKENFSSLSNISENLFNSN